MSGSAERRNRCREANSAHRNILELSTRTLSRACPGHPWLRLTDDLHGCRLTGSNPPDRTIRTGGLSSRKRGFWKLPKILGRSLSPGFSGQAIEFLHILRIGIGPALLSERGKKLFG